MLYIIIYYVSAVRSCKKIKQSQRTNTNEGQVCDYQDDVRGTANELEQKTKKKTNKTCVMVADSSNIHQQPLIIHMSSNWVKSVNGERKSALMFVCPIVELIIKCFLNLLLTLIILEYSSPLMFIVLFPAEQLQSTFSKKSGEDRGRKYKRLAQ